MNQLAVNTVSSLSLIADKISANSFSLPVELLQIPDIKIIGTDFDYGERIIFTVESTHNETCCHQCGKPTKKTDGHEKPRLIRHLSLFSNKTYIRITPKRCRCECGAITIQTFSWYTPRTSCTSIYEDYLLLQMINSTVSDVSIKEQIGYEMLNNIIDRKISTSSDWKHIKKLKS